MILQFVQALPDLRPITIRAGPQGNLRPYPSDVWSAALHLPDEQNEVLRVFLRPSSHLNKSHSTVL